MYRIFIPMIMIMIIVYIPHTDNQSQYTSESTCSAVNGNGQKSQDKRVVATVVINSEVDNLDDVINDKRDEDNLFLIQSIHIITISLINSILILSRILSQHLLQNIPI